MFICCNCLYIDGMFVNVNGILIVYGFKFVGKNEFVIVIYIINFCKFMV